MTQRITIGGKQYDIVGTPHLVSRDLTKINGITDLIYLREVSQPKESERLWGEHKKIAKQHGFKIIDDVERAYADYILARVKEELIK